MKLKKVIAIAICCIMGDNATADATQGTWKQYLGDKILSSLIPLATSVIGTYTVERIRTMRTEKQKDELAENKNRKKLLIPEERKNLIRKIYRIGIYQNQPEPTKKEIKTMKEELAWIVKKRIKELQRLRITKRRATRMARREEEILINLTRMEMVKNIIN